MPFKPEMGSNKKIPSVAPSNLMRMSMPLMYKQGVQKTKVDLDSESKYKESRAGNSNR